MLWWISIISALLIIVQTQAATQVGGIFLQNTVWTNSSSTNPYQLIKDVQIPRNVTLTIQPGVKINFSQGDFEIFVQGFLKIQGTSAQPVIFEGGSVINSKCMIKFRSTRLSRSSIRYTQFKGPQKALQLADAPDGIQDNTDTLIIESSAFLANTGIDANGNYPRNLSSPVPSLEFRSCNITQTTISTSNVNSEPIRIINSKIVNGTFIPRAGTEGIQIKNCTMRNTTINYDYNAQSSQFQLNNSDVLNTTVIYSDWYDSGPQSRFIAGSSVIRDFTISLGLYTYTAQSIFIFEDSTLYNVSTSSYFTGWFSQYPSPSIDIRNCKLTLGNLIIGNSYFNYSISIRNSVLNNVNFTTSSPQDNEYNTQKPLIIRNTSFINGMINLPGSHADISYSTITLLSPPLSIGGSTRILCSSISRSDLLLKSDTVGIVALGLNLTKSTIKNFAVGLRITPPALNTATISGTNFVSNSQYNIDNEGVYNVTAKGIYWGTNNGGVIVSKIHDYWDDINYGDVIYTSYSSAALPAETGCNPNKDYLVETTTLPYWGK